MTKRQQLWLRLFFSVGLFLFLFYTVDLEQMAATLARSRPSFLLVAFLFALGDRMIMAYKWTILLTPRGIGFPFTNVLGVYWVSSFLGLFLPATIGGDALRAYAVSKDGYKTADIISSIIVERILGFIALFLFVLAGIALSVFVFGEQFIASIWHLFWIFVALLVFSVGFLSLSLYQPFLQWIQASVSPWLGKLPDHKLVAKLKDAYRSYAAYRNHQQALILFLLLSLVENLFPLLWTYFLALAFRIDVPFLYFFILVPIVLVLVRLPISLDGFGIQEGAFVYFLGLIGVAHADAFLLGISSHLLAILSLLPGGILYALVGLKIRPDLASKEDAHQV